MSIYPEQPQLRVLVATADAPCLQTIQDLFTSCGWGEPHAESNSAGACRLLLESTWDLLILDRSLFLEASGSILNECGSPGTTLAFSSKASEVTAPPFCPWISERRVFDWIDDVVAPDQLRVAVTRAYEHASRRAREEGTEQLVSVLLSALESKDKFLAGHSARVVELAVGLGQRFGLSADELQILNSAARLHDVGKVGVHEDILNKPGPLTAEEFEIMKRHPVISRDLLSPVKLLAPCLPIVYHHHERIDGRGYPDGIGGSEIPLGARILGVCDAYAAMSSKRAYREALPHAQVLEVLRSAAGTQLDSELVELFLENLADIARPAGGMAMSVE